MNREILRLAIPNIISNISIPLLGIVDLAVLGHLESELYIGAISLGGTIFNFIYWGFAFLRMGTSGMTAQEYGRKNTKETMAILLRALLVGIAGSVAIVIMQYPIAELSFALIEGSTEVEQLAREYFYIRIWAAPASLALFALTGWFIGMQDARTPMYITIAINILNIALNLWLVIGQGMKSNGVAWATLIAQYVGFIAALIVIYFRYRNNIAEVQVNLIFRMNEFKRFFAVNTDIFIRMICIIFVFTFFNFRSAAINDTILAVNTVLMSFFMLFSFFADGFAYAGEALVGKYTGENNTKMRNKTIRYLFLWGISIGVLITVVYAIAGSNIMRLITDNQDVIQAAKPFMIWVIIIPVVSFASFIWDGIYIGATATKLMRNTMLFAAFGMFLPSYLILSEYYQNQALWVAFIIFMIGRGALQTILFRRI